MHATKLAFFLWQLKNLIECGLVLFNNHVGRHTYLITETSVTHYTADV